MSPQESPQELEDAQPGTQDRPGEGAERRTLAARIAYLQGLADALEGDDGGPERQLLRGTLAALETLAGRQDQLTGTLAGVTEVLEAVEERLAQLARVFDDEETFWEVPCPDCMEVFAVSEDALFGASVTVRCPACDTLVRWGPSGADDEANGRDASPARGPDHPDHETPERLDGTGPPYRLHGHGRHERPRPQSRTGHLPIPDPPTGP